MFIKQMMTALSLFSASMGGYDRCEQNSGSMFCGDIIVEQVVSNGVASMRGTVVKQEVVINGTLYASDVIINQLTVNGTANILNSNIKERTEINGTLDAKSTDFKGPIYFGSNTAAFENCSTRDIFVGHVNSSESRVYLSGTKVMGNITFLGRKGIAYVCNGSKINGKIVNGEIIESC